MTGSATPSRVCSQPGCPDLAIPAQAHCGKHTPERGAHHKIYGTKRWRLFRLSILKQRRWCERCLPQGKLKSPIAGCTETTTGLSNHVHHKIDLADGGAPFDPNNVEALSHSCHSRETAARRLRKTGGGSSKVSGPMSAERGRDDVSVCTISRTKTVRYP